MRLWAEHARAKSRFHRHRIEIRLAISARSRDCMRLAGSRLAKTADPPHRCRKPVVEQPRGPEDGMRRGGLPLAGRVYTRLKNAAGAFGGSGPKAKTVGERHASGYR